jgi:hypothetical protein
LNDDRICVFEKNNNNMSLVLQSGYNRGTFREHSRNIQGILSGHSVNILEMALNWLARRSPPPLPGWNYCVGQARSLIEYRTVRQGIFDTDYPSVKILSTLSATERR